LDGYVVGPASATDTAIVRYDGTTGKLVQSTGITIDGSDNIANAGTYNGVTVETHASRHESGGADQIDLTGLIDLDGYVVGPASATDTALVRYDGTTGKLVQNSGITVDGSDNISNAGTYNGVTVEGHASRHESGGADQIDVTGLINLDGYVVGPASATDTAIVRYDGTTGKLVQNTGITVDGSDNIANAGTFNGVTVETHASRHESGGADQIDVTGLVNLDGYVVGPASATDTALVRYDGTTGKLVQDSGITVDGSNNISNAGTFNSVTVETHASRHESGGADEIDLTGLISLDGYVVGPASSTDTALVRYDGTTGKLVQDSGITVDGSDNISNAGTYNGVTVETHASRHESGGADEISLAGLINLDGYVVGPASATDTAIVRFDGTTGKLVQNTGITIDGSDNISNAGTYNSVTVENHSARHENGGGDEISVASLSGELADAQKVAVSKNSGATVGTRSTLNFIEGSNITLTIADDAGGNEVDITIDSSGGAVDLDGYVVGPASATDEGIVRYDGTTGKLVQDSSITIDDTGNLLIRSNNELRFYDNGNYVGFEAPALTGDQIWILPDADSTGTQFLRSDGSGNLSWGTPAGGGDVVWIGGASVDNTIPRFHLTTGQIIQGSGVTIDDSNNLLLDADTSTQGAPRTYGFVNLSSTEATRFDFDQGGGEGLGHVFGGGITIYSEHAIVLRGDRELGTPPATWDTETGIGVLISNTVAATEALVVRGATSQTGALQEWRDVSDNVLHEVQADGDVFTTTNGSTVSPVAPRVFGFKDFSTGEACAFQFGDANTGIQHGWDSALQVYAWHPIVLQGDIEAAGPPAFISAVGPDLNFGVMIDNQQADGVALVVRGETSQTAALQEWRNVSDTMLAEVQDDGTFNLNNKDIDNIKTGTFNSEYAYAGGATLDWNNGQKQGRTLTANTSITTFTNPPGPCNLILRIQQAAASSYTISFPSAVEWPGGTAPTMTTTNNAVDIFAFYFDGSIYYGVASQNFS
jgi:hypothetical protein